MFRRISVENLWITGARRRRYKNKIVFRLPLVTMLLAIIGIPSLQAGELLNLWKTHRFNVLKCLADNVNYTTILGMLGITRIFQGGVAQTEKVRKVRIVTKWLSYSPTTSSNLQLIGSLYSFSNHFHSAPILSHSTST